MDKETFLFYCRERQNTIALGLPDTMEDNVAYVKAQKQLLKEVTNFINNQK